MEITPSQPSVKKTEAKVLANRPSPEITLFPNFFCDSLLETVKVDMEMSQMFLKTLDEYEKIVSEVENGSKDKKELYRKSIPVIAVFTNEFKLCAPEIKKKLVLLMKGRTAVPFGQAWFDFSTENSLPFEFKRIVVPDNTPVGNINSVATPSPSDGPRKVIFTNFQGPGDIVMMTAAIRDLHINHPGKFITDVRTSSMHIWEGNPYVEWAKGKPLDDKDPSISSFRLPYELIHQSNQGPYHFSEAFTEEIEQLLNVRIRRRIGKGDIYIRPEEDIWGFTERATWFKEYDLDPNGDFWIIDCGHKTDFTAKFWGKGKYQAVVDHFKGKIKFVQIGHSTHIHFPLEGAVNLIGKTDDRQMIRLVWASSGVLTPVSWPMTLAAAVPVKYGKCNGREERPCVVVAGGREPSRWQAHCNHMFVHTNGCLPCCSRGGCWKSRAKPIGDGDEKDFKNLCENVTVDDYGEEVPYCMHMISVDDVIRKIDMYFEFYNDERKKYTYNKPVGGKN